MHKLKNGEWSHVAQVFDGENTRLYVGGECVEALGYQYDHLHIKPGPDGCEIVMLDSEENRTLDEIRAKAIPLDDCDDESAREE